MILDDCVRIRDLHSKSSDPMFARAIPGLLHQSLDPYFAPNIIIIIIILYEKNIFISKMSAVCNRWTGLLEWTTGTTFDPNFFFRGCDGIEP